MLIFFKLCVGLFFSLFFSFVFSSLFFFFFLFFLETSQPTGGRREEGTKQSLKSLKSFTNCSKVKKVEFFESTSCGWIYFGDHLLETYSSTQQIVVLSTAESEYISITKGAAHALEVRSAMVEFGLTFNVVCETDASAGRAMATRRGVGRVRHLDARLLWLQQLCAEGVVQV